MTILFPLPPKPLGNDNEEVPNNPRDNVAMQQYQGPLKFQKMLGWLTAMSTLTGAHAAQAGTMTAPGQLGGVVLTTELLPFDAV